MFSFFPLRKTAFFLAAAGAFSLTSCTDDGEDEIVTPTYEIPATYNFANANYSGQTTRMDMLAAISNYIKTGNTIGTKLSAAKLRAMYANSNSPFESADIANFAELNAATTKQLKDKTYSADQPTFEAYFDSLEVASSATTAGSKGKPGVVSTVTGTSSKYLLSANGFEYSQLINKQIMGSVFFYQAMETYLTDAKIGPGVNNATVIAGEGTAMEHAFDEAFGYFGANIDFPNNVSTSKYWANYSNQVNPALGSNKTLMDAFLKGRAAISNKDTKAKNEAVATIRKEWEKVVAASAIHEMNSAKQVLASSTRDQARVSHYLSEAIGFIKSLRYKSDRINTDAQLNSVLNKIGTNLYNTSLSDVNAAITELSTIYSLQDIKDSI